MTMPKSFHPRFIGSLIKMAKQYPKDSPIWCHLWLAVEQMREHNAGTAPAEIHELNMLRTQRELRELGVMVG